MLLTLATLTGCVKDNLIDSDNLKGNINFKVDGNWDDDEILTKAVLQDVKNDGISIFGVKGSTLLFDNEKLSFVSGAWTYSNTQYWIEGNTYKFFSMYPYSSSGYNYSTSDNSISYTANEGTDYMWDAHVRTYNGTNSGPVELAMNHAMSQVQIDVANNSDVQITVTGATLSGEYNKATCTIDESTNPIVEYTNFANNGTTVNPGNLNVAIEPNQSDYIFAKFVIPQTIQQNTILTISYNGTNSSIDLYDVRSYCNEWEVGKTHKYVVSLGEGAGISVYVENGVVYVENISSLNEFVRAAITGNWFNGDDIVAHSSGPVSVTPASNWSQPLDGSSFSYYNQTLIHGTKVPLLSSIPNAPSDGPVGATWKLTILVQAIIDDDASVTSAQGAFGN